MMKRGLQHLVFLAFLCLTLAACRSYQPVPNGSWLDLEAGERLRVELHSGERHHVRLESIDEDRLVSHDLEVALADVAVIERDMGTNNFKTVVFLGILGAALMIAVLNAYKNSLDIDFNF